MGRKAKKEAPKEGKVRVELVGDWYFRDLGGPRIRGEYRRVAVPAGIYNLCPELVDKRLWLIVERLEGDGRRHGISYASYVEARDDPQKMVEHKIIEISSHLVDTHEKSPASTETSPTLALSQAT